MTRAALFALVLAFASTANGERMAFEENPRYAENPIYLFFEAYIQDVVGHLPEEKSLAIQDLNIQKVFDTKASEWKKVVEETLHLSPTIQIAILDLWFRNREHFRGEEGILDPVWFSQIFTDEYFKEGSQIDVWPEGALAAAEKRVQQAQASE